MLTSNMILKYALKYACFVVVILYGTMTLSLVSRLWIQIKMSQEPYQITNFSDLELKKYDAEQVKDLQVFETSTEESTKSKTDWIHFRQNDINPRKETRKLKSIKDRKKKDKIAKDDDSNEETFIEVNEISVFSAYYDKRGGVENTFVRIFGLMHGDSKENLVCGFKGDEKRQWILAEKHEMCENHGKLYGGYMFNCKIPGYIKVVPKTVYLHSLSSISVKIPLNISDAIALDVKHIKLKREKSKSNFEKDVKKTYNTGNGNANNKTKFKEDLRIGVCVSPMYGKINLSNLIQCIELLKLQGVNHIIMYKMKISKSAQILLDYYQTQGQITVVNWTLPSFIRTNQIWYNGQIIMIQDCLHRAMGNFDYLSFLDLDEAIIPRLDFHWSDLINRLEFLSINEDPNAITAGFSFESAYFDPESQDNHVDSFQKLSFLNALQRNKVLSHHRTKVIVKPELVKEMGIHHVSSTINLMGHTIDLMGTGTNLMGQIKNVTIHKVRDDIGLIHHFKGCSAQMDPGMICDNSIEDKSILKYSKFLIEQYNSALKNNLKYFKTLT